MLPSGTQEKLEWVITYYVPTKTYHFCLFFSMLFTEA